MRTSDSSEARGRLAADTSRAAEEHQLDIWRQMSSVELARVVDDAWEFGMSLARAGLRERYPSAGDDELRVRLAVLQLGRDLASRVYPDAGPWLEP